MTNAAGKLNLLKPLRKLGTSASTQVLATITGILLLSLAASAAPIIQVHIDGFDPSPYAVFGRSVIDPADGQRVNSNQMDGGRFAMTLLDAGAWDGEFVGGDAFYTFCIEPREFITLGNNYTYEIRPLEQGTTNIGGMGTAKANLLRELFGRYLPNFSAPLTALEAGALQIAIWEIVREDSGPLNVYNGSIYFYTNSSTNPAGTLARAQQMLSSIDGTGPKLNNLVALTSSGGVQDLVGQVNTPEPATFALAGFALLGIGLQLRRRRQA